VATLLDWLRIPSISAQPDHAAAGELLHELGHLQSGSVSEAARV
jgi:hypothetical protein